MQASTLSLVAAAPLPAGSPGPRNTRTGAEGFSRILDEPGPEDQSAKLADGASATDEQKSSSPDDLTAIDPTAKEQGQVPENATAPPMPLPPQVVAQAIAAVADPILPAASDEMPGPLAANLVAGPLASATLPAGTDTQGIPQQSPVYSAAQPIAAPGRPPLPEARAPQTPPSKGDTVAAPAPQVTPATASQPLAVATFPSPTPELKASIRIAPSGTDARRPYTEGTAALSFALRSALGAADDAKGASAIGPADLLAATIAANAAPDASSSSSAAASELTQDPRDDTLSITSPSTLPLPDRPASPNLIAQPTTALSLPANLGHDIAAIVDKSPDAPVEISLSPDELGKLRVSLWQDGSGLRVMVQAERAETLDLLRRNGEHLMQEIRAAGFAGGSLSFGQWGGPPNRPEPPATVPQPEPTEPLSNPAPPHRAPANLALSSSLDLRY